MKKNSTVYTEGDSPAVQELADTSPQTANISHDISMVRTATSLHSRCTYTVEPLNKGQIGTLTPVHYSEVAFYWEVSKIIILVGQCTAFLVSGSELKHV